MFALSFLGSACLHCLQNSMAELHWYPFIEVKEFNMPGWQKRRLPPGELWPVQP